MCFCQNPNLTTTQPNLNLVGFHTIIAVHTNTTPPTHPTRNSTSTRNKGPSGLKICMRPHLTKLTTTQHNFNPTIFWVGRGGGHAKLTLPEFFLAKSFSDLNVFDQRIFWLQNFFDPKFFLHTNFFDPRIFLTQKFFWSQNFLTQNI